MFAQTENNKRRRRRLFFGLAAVMLVVVMLIGVQVALANTRIDSDGQVPFYARFGQNETSTDGETVVIVFYRSPSCIPADFDLIQFFHFPGPGDPGAFGCQPPTTDGFEIWENGPGIDPAPKLGVLEGRGAVPVWFVSVSDLQTVTDGGVYINELAGLPSLQSGTASYYHETLRPSQTTDNYITNYVARGTLDGSGVSFSVHSTRVGASGHYNVQIAFGP
ncbi:MAG: hypothetical protein PVH18_02330 [Chloroflexota bacterium]|jgi:hypothetical protein